MLQFIHCDFAMTLYRTAMTTVITCVKAARSYALYLVSIKVDGVTRTTYFATVDDFGNLVPSNDNRSVYVTNPEV